MSAIVPIPVSIAGSPRLHGNLWLPAGEGPHPAALLCHGFASTHQEWRDFPQQLAEAGYAALAFDFRGHGQSEGARTYVTAESHIEDLGRALETLRARSEVDGRFTLIGHSLGTAAVLRALGTGVAAKAQAAVLFAPPNRIRQDVSLGQWVAYAAASRVAKVVLNAFGQHLMVPYQVTEADIFLDAQAAARAKADGILARQITLNNYDYLMTEQNNSAAAASVQVPTCVVVGKQDAVIANVHSRQTFEALACKAKHWVEIDGSGHSLLGDARGAEAAAAALAWLRTHVPSAADMAV